MNRDYPYTDIDRRRLADEIAGETPTNGGGRTIPSTVVAAATAAASGGGGGVQAVVQHFLPPPPPKRTKVDPSMTVTTDELQCAQEIKRVLESNTDTRIPLNPESWSDYDYAQQAITITADLTDEESTKSLMRQMYKLQSFKEEYNIRDTVEEGVRLIQQLMQMMPGYLLSIDYAPRYGSYIAVFDYAAFRPELLRMNDDLRVFLGASYYIFQCLSTTLKAVRSGAVFITECQGMQNENFDQQVEEKYIHHLFGHYPFKHKECLWLNCPTIANIAYGLLKSQMPPGFLATWRLGCKLDGYEGRIDGLFKVPTFALAQEQLLVRIQGFLSQRGQHAGGFELHQRMVYNPPPPPPQQQQQPPAARAGVARGAAAQRPPPAAAGRQQARGAGPRQALAGPRPHNMAAAGAAAHHHQLRGQQAHAAAAAARQVRHQAAGGTTNASMTAAAAVRQQRRQMAPHHQVPRRGPPGAVPDVYHRAGALQHHHVARRHQGQAAVHPPPPAAASAGRPLVVPRRPPQVAHGHPVPVVERSRRQGEGPAVVAPSPPHPNTFRHATTSMQQGTRPQGQEELQSK